MDLRIFTEPQQGAAYDDQLAVAKVAEEEGFDAFFRSDHYLAMGADGMPGPTDSWITLAGLARDTSRIRLGTLVSSATFRLPGPLAIMVAQVDAMSGGRVELGLGSGWFTEEHEAYGIPLPDTSERFERLEEQLAIVTGLWGTPAGQRFDFPGRHYQLRDSPALPKPAQSPLPIIVGGRGARRTPALVARFASEYNTPFLAPPKVAEQNRRVNAACEAIGRDPASVRRSSVVTVCCGSDETELARRRAAIARHLDHWPPVHLFGTPEQVAEGLQEYADAGATTAYLQVLDLSDLDHLRLLGREVAPLVQG